MIKITTPHEVMDGRILNVRARFDVVSVGTGPVLGDTDSINELEAVIVRRIFAEYASGTTRPRSSSAICGTL